ncbi:MAG TPA: fatty acid desaturase [Stellaceae bacterium]|nr:fatty acid desaturase [Stellaceae bacterium]
MQASSARDLRLALAPYLSRSTPIAVALFLANIALYVAAVGGAVALGAWPARLACAVVAGSAISALFVIGHDAAHGAYAKGRLANAVIGRIAFLPALHNYSLWQVQHNRLHHRLVNIKGFNSWSPLSKAEYDAMPPWRRWVQRLYRGPFGFAPYYLIERWWRDKFFPRRRAGAARHAVFWADFALLAAYLAGFIALLARVGSDLPQSSAAAAVAWGFAVPFLVWNMLMGATTYMQHTHRQAPWFAAQTDVRRLVGQEDLSVHVVVPRWYGAISHHIMDHPAHHVHPKIPLYRLAAAQRRLNELLGERAVVQRFTPAYLWDTLTCCKLYDYREHRWLDFAGRATSACTLPERMRRADTPGELTEARAAV